MTLAWSSKPLSKVACKSRAFHQHLDLCHSKLIARNWRVIKWFHYCGTAQNLQPLQAMVLVQLSFPPNHDAHLENLVRGFQHYSDSPVVTEKENLFQIGGYLYHICWFMWCKGTPTDQRILTYNFTLIFCSWSHIAIKHYVSSPSWQRLDRHTRSEKPASPLPPKNPLPQNNVTIILHQSYMLKHTVKLNIKYHYI